jgi:predicted sulfurtransferase
MDIVAFSGYKFIPLTGLESLQLKFKQKAQALALKGTILLSSEGININLAGSPQAYQDWQLFLQQNERFQDIELKHSPAQTQPFAKLLVKQKESIITLKQAQQIQPPSEPEDTITPQQLSQWLDRGEKVTLLDTRNHYEHTIGSFDAAVKFDIKTFGEFPQQFQQHFSKDSDTPVVMFCTGGVRCEKVLPYLKQQGYRHIYQLQGGILKYLEQCGAKHWQGECFVFDNRIAVDSQLQETPTQLCQQCQIPVTQDNQAKPAFQKYRLCSACAEAANASA